VSGEINVSILGHTYTIRGEADPDYIRELAAYVDDKMRTVRERNATAPPLEAAVMVAVNIADELFREREAARGVDGMLESRFRELSDVLQRR